MGAKLVPRYPPTYSTRGFELSPTEVGGKPDRNRSHGVGGMGGVGGVPRAAVWSDRGQGSPDSIDKRSASCEVLNNTIDVDTEVSLWAFSGFLSGISSSALTSGARALKPYRVRWPHAGE